jgi:hypothetical protein
MRWGEMVMGALVFTHSNIDHTTIIAQATVCCLKDVSNEEKIKMFQKQVTCIGKNVLKCIKSCQEIHTTNLT